MGLLNGLLGLRFGFERNWDWFFLEKVYENAMRIELRSDGLEVEQQRPISIVYKGEIVGEYYADLLVANCVIVELKAARAIESMFLAQALNYLRATKMPVALLLKFWTREVGH